MQISVAEAAKLLFVSEKTVYRWLREGRIPGYKVGEVYRFNRAELLEWATARRIRVSPEIMAEPADSAPLPSFAEALRAGGIVYRLNGRDKTEVLQAVVEAMRLPMEVDREFLLAVLLAREDLGSTGVGHGIAIPHPRSPVVLHVGRPTVTLCFLDQPVDYGAIDGEPVHTLFTIVSPTVRAHLLLLSRLSFALHSPEVQNLLAARASREEILAAFAAVEATIPQRAEASE